jgi:hypothetical protein
VQFFRIRLSDHYWRIDKRGLTMIVQLWGLTCKPGSTRGTFTNLTKPFYACAALVRLFLGLRFLYALLEPLHQVNNLFMPRSFWGCNRDLPTFALFAAVSDVPNVAG